MNATLHPNRRFVLAVLAAGALAACGGGGSDPDDAEPQRQPQPPQASAVRDWNAFASDSVATGELAPVQTWMLALVQIAVHDALNAVEPRYRPYRYQGRAPGASPDAAVAAATHGTLVRLLPLLAPEIDARFEARLAALEDGAAKDAGVAAGRAAAAAILQARGSDDLLAAIGQPYAPAARAPGVYEPTAPSNLVIGAGLGAIRPFSMDAAAQFRSPPPPDVAGRDYARDYDEVKALGSAQSTLRSAAQTQTGRFWYDAATREWHQAARAALDDVAADDWSRARILALMSVAMQDGVVASLEGKFVHNFWRPVTAIRAGDHDGNDATAGDAHWEPLCATPPFPEYNSTHAVIGAAAAGVLARTLGDRHAFEIESPTLPGVRRRYGRFSDAAFEESISRIYCGIHFRSAMDAGFAQGRRIAEHAVERLLQPQAPQRLAEADGGG